MCAAQVLTELQRALDEMALGVGCGGAAARSAALVLEAVPVVRQALLRGVGDWQAAAAEQARAQFSEAAARRLMAAQAQAWMAQLDMLAGLSEKMGAAPPGAADAAGGGGGPAGAGAAGQAAGPGPVQVSCWRKVAEGPQGAAGRAPVLEAWCELEVRVDDARPPEPVALEELHALRCAATQPAGQPHCGGAP